MGLLELEVAHGLDNGSLLDFSGIEFIQIRDYDVYVIAKQGNCLVKCA